MTYRGQVKGGVVVLEPGADLPEGTTVSIEAITSDHANANDPLREMGKLAVNTGIPDLATNIDHYLYGHPKVNDAR